MAGDGFFFCGHFWMKQKTIENSPQVIIIIIGVVLRAFNYPPYYGKEYELRYITAKN